MFLNFWQLILIALFLFLIIYGFLPVFRIWKSGFKHPTVLPFIGTIHWIALRGYQRCLTEWNRDLGPIYVIAYGQQLTYHIGDPVVLKDVLIKSFHTFPNRRLFPLISGYFKKSVFFLNDDEWRKSRKQLIPIFMSKMKLTFLPHMRECAARMVNNLTQGYEQSLKVKADEPAAASFTTRDNTLIDEFENLNNNRLTKGYVVSSKQVFGCYSMDSIASTAFGLDIDSSRDEYFVKHAKKILDFEVSKPFMAFILIFPFTLPILRYFDVVLADIISLQFFKDTILRVLKERRQLNIVRKDLVQLFVDSKKTRKNMKPNGTCNMSAVDSESCPINKSKEIHGTQSIEDFFPVPEQTPSQIQNNAMDESKQKQDIAEENVEDEGMDFTDEEYISNALLFFIAGYESTSSSMCWLARALAWNPEIQEKLRAEIEEMLEHKRRTHFKSNEIEMEDSVSRFKILEEITYEEIESLKYLTQIIKESMRLQPSTMFFDRYSAAEHVILPTKDDDKPLRIPKGSIIEVPIYAIHRDERNWSNPNIFDPDRFEGKESIIDQQCRFIPFGNGPRNCIGFRFALLEMKIGIIYLLGSGIRFLPGPNDKKRDLSIYENRFKRNLLNFPIQGIDLTIEIMQ